MRLHDPETALPTPCHRTTGCAWLIVALAMVAFGAKAPKEQHTQHAMADEHRAAPHSPTLMGTAKPFGALMGEAMVSMDDAMKAAPMTGDPDHDFAAMMIPHHQGAIDMARAELLYGTDPPLRRPAIDLVVHSAMGCPRETRRGRRIRACAAQPPWVIPIDTNTLPD